MNQIKLLAGRLGIALCCALPGYLGHAQPSVSIGITVPTVEIRVESDFYEPLAPQGEWVVIGSYGRCWRPSHVARDWRPYCNGNWERTDAGWYWVSDEPWAWATYHYGRWNYASDGGWYWVPQVQWAPAWVSWHSGGGYVGWVPLQPAGVTVILPQAYIFVGEADFLKPVRSSTVIVNNTTIIKQTVVIQQGPSTAVIEKASGRKIAAVPVQELRHKTEAAVVTRQKTSPAAAVEKKAQPPVHSEAQPVEKKAVTPREPAQVEKSAPAHDPVAPAPQERKVQNETRKSVPAPAEPAPEARPEGKSKTATTEPVPPKAEKRAVETPARPAGKKVQPPAQEAPAASEKGNASPDDKGQGQGQGKKDKE